MKPWWIAASLAAASFALYAFTAAPDLALVDSAELALVCATGGVPHPPGVPLYRLLGGIFAHLPVESPARALNLMSAFFAALTVGATFLAAERMLAFVERISPSGNGPSANRHYAAAAASLAFATSWNPWTWSAVAEVYSLNTFLIAAAWACGWAALVSGASSRPAFAAVFLAAFGLANHHATAALAFPVLFFMAAVARPSLVRSRVFLSMSLGAVALAASLYLTLLPAARNDPGLGWGGTRSLMLLGRHITGRQYSLQVSGATSEEMLRVAREFASTLFFGGGLPQALLAIAGVSLVFFLLTRKAARREGAWALLAPVLMIAANVALSTKYIAGPEDRMAYDLPAAIAWSLLAALGAKMILDAVPSWRAVVAAVLLAAPATVNVARNIALCNLREERTARRFVEEMLGDAPPNAVLVTAEWNLYGPYLYLRHLEGWRRDLRVIDVLMLRRFWYLDYIEREYPQLVADSRPEFDRFRDEIRLFDVGLPYDQVNIQRYYDELLQRWVAIGRADGGAFADWLMPTLAQESSWVSQLPTRPDGLRLRFVSPDEAAAPGLAPRADPQNLRYVRSKLTDASLAGDRSTLVPRHDPYWRVWGQYQAAATASLLVALRDGEPALRQQYADLAQWFPEHDFVLRRVSSR